MRIIADNLGHAENGNEQDLCTFGIFVVRMCP
jgi:hypothetical protein